MGRSETTKPAAVSKPVDGHEPPPLEAVSPLKRFLHHDLVGTGFLLSAAVLALVVANSPWGDAYHHLWETHLGVSVGDWAFDKPVHLWINDGLMAIFFFLVGLEIKRELVAGELATARKAILPAVAAVGGMAVPAAIYAAINVGGDGMVGWGIPMATDIAFAAGCIAMLRKWVPPAVMVFLVALAIVDDLGAVTVIALFYTDHLDVPALVVGGAMITVSAALGLAGVRRTTPYVLIGIVVWFAFLRSGVHATIAGVLLAFTIPTDARYRSELFADRVRELLHRFRQADEQHKMSLANPEAPGRGRLLVSARQQDLIRALNQECHHVEAPLQRIEHNLEPWTVFLIMPVFAFANAGLHLDWAHLGELVMKPVTLGVFFGLLVGKPLGIVGASWLAVKSGLASLPAGVTWKQVFGMSLLAGIGFTMSLFIADLAFPASGPHREYLAEAKLGIFCASLIAGAAGLLTLKLVCREPQPQARSGGH